MRAVTPSISRAVGKRSEGVSAGGWRPAEEVEEGRAAVEPVAQLDVIDLLVAGEIEAIIA